LEKDYIKPNQAAQLKNCAVVIISNEKTVNGKTAVKATFRMEAKPEIVYVTLRDTSSFPEFMPNAKKVQVLESGAGYQIIRFLGSSSFWKSDVIIKQIFDDTDRHISWTLIKGNKARAVDGFWRVETERNSQGSFVTYLNYVDAGALIPDFIVRHFLRNDISQMVANLRKRVNSYGVWKSKEYLQRVQ